MIGAQAPKPPFQFIILKSILYENCGGGFCSFTNVGFIILALLSASHGGSCSLFSSVKFRD